MRGIGLIRLRIGIIGNPCECGIEPPDFLGLGASQFTGLNITTLARKKITKLMSKTQRYEKTVILFYPVFIVHSAGDTQVLQKNSETESVTVVLVVETDTICCTCRRQSQQQVGRHRHHAQLESA